jgi:hypothetical protein
LYKKGENASKTKGKEEREPPNYKFLGGETEEIGSPNVVFMRPQLVKIYNERKNRRCSKTGANANYSAKSKGASP